MTGKSIADIPRLCFPDILITHTTPSVTYMLKPKGAETFPQLVKRTHQLLTSLKKKHKNGNILLVTHGDFGKMIYAAYHQLPWKDVLLQFHFGNSDLLLLSPDTKPNQSRVFLFPQHNL